MFLKRYDYVLLLLLGRLIIEVGECSELEIVTELLRPFAELSHNSDLFPIDLLGIKSSTSAKISVQSNPSCSRRIATATFISNPSFLYPIIRIFGFTLPNPVRSSIEARPVWRFELSAMEQNPLMLVNLSFQRYFQGSEPRCSYLNDIRADHQGVIFTDEIDKVYESRTSVIFFSYVPNDFYCEMGLCY
uniref:Uncharacterized protein n=1 Tax=Daphnia galeata TaxID=27404 RepID=A0A8J2WPS7_9CRUS|nr:unnamed protein product [Daphnia galeata]